MFHLNSMNAFMPIRYRLSYIPSPYVDLVSHDTRGVVLAILRYEKAFVILKQLNWSFLKLHVSLTDNLFRIKFKIEER